MRTPRAQTPAKKENATIDGFAAALKYDQQLREIDGRSLLNPSQPIIDTASQSITLISKEPQQLLIYGFASEFQWSAISFYERVSGGIICEDYPRDPPAEKRKYNNAMSSSSVSAIRRTLTQAERILASQYHGGDCWIVVTLDSHEAAERALAASPHSVNGYWTFAEPWRGIGPAKDASIFGDGDADSAKSIAMGSGVISRKHGKRRALPRQPERSIEIIPDDATETSTVTSATATAGEEMEDVDRSQQSLSFEQGEQSLAISPPPTKTHFTHFPNTPRTIMKPVKEALLPQPTWWEGVLKSLAASGWIPGDMIGGSIPRRDDGSFDPGVASIYWRFWYWFDGLIGTDLCGMKED